MQMTRSWWHRARKFYTRRLYNGNHGGKQKVWRRIEEKRRYWSVVVRKVQCRVEEKVSCLAVYVRGESAIIRFCATVARNVPMSSVVVWKEVCIRQANPMSAEAVRKIGRSQVELILITMWIMVMGYRWKR